MSDENTPNEDRLSAIDTYLQRGDCYGAEEVWERLNHEWKSGKTVYTRATLDEKLHQITETSRHLVEQIIGEIEAMLKLPTVDERAARNKLDQLKRALISQEQDRYDTISRRLLSHVQLQKENVLFADIEKTITQLWDNAIALQLQDKGINPARLLPYYTQALEEANRQVLNYQNSDYSPSFKNRLLALQQEAEKRRNSVNTAEASLTSGALVGDYIKTLQYIRDVSPDMLVQVYDPSGNTIENSTDKVSAYKIYSKRALDFTREKLITYMDGGEGRLGIRQFLELGRPREAKELYDHYIVTFGELETKYVSDITRTAERQDLFKLEAQITLALDQFTQVETRCDALAKRAEAATTRPDLISLWNEFLSALKQYPLAQQTSVVVKQTEEIIQERFRSYLVRVADEIDVAIQLIDLDRARLIIRENRTVLELPFVKNEDVARRIANYETELTVIDQQLAQIEAAIMDLSSRLVTDSTDNLKTSLEQIKHKYSNATELLRKKNFDALEQKVIARDSAVEGARRLEMYLASESVTEVRSKAEYARQQANENPIYENIAAQLEACLEFLNAENLALNERVSALHKLLTSGRVSHPKLRERVTNAYTRADAEQRLVLTNGVSFTRAEDELARKNYADVWKSLEMIKTPYNADEEQKWARLFIQSVNEYPIDKELDANVLEGLGALSKKLPQSYEPPRYANLLAVQRARELPTIQEKIDAYEAIRKRLSGSDASILEDMINALRQTQFEDESNKLLTNRPSPDQLEKWLEGLNEYAQKALDLARRQPNQAGGYYLNSLKLDVLFVQNTPIHANRDSIAIRISETAVRIDNLTSFTKTMSEADSRLLEAAKHMKQIVGTMDEMTKYITKAERNIRQFKETLDKLQGYFDGTKRYREVLRDFSGQYDAHINTVYTELSNENNATRQADRYTPKAFLRYVKMLLLRPQANQELDAVIQAENLRDRFIAQLQETFEAFMAVDSDNLSDVLRNLEEQYRDLQSFIGIVEHASLKQFQEFASEIKDTAGIIPKLIDAVQKFDDRVRSFKDRLTTYDLTYTALNQYRLTLTQEYATLETEVNTLFDTLTRDVRIINLYVGNVGATHPVMTKLEQALLRLLDTFDEVVKNWTAILILASRQDFTHALQQMENFETQLSDQFQIFQTKSLYTDKLPAKLPQEDDDAPVYLPNVTGYAGLKNWLREGISTYDQLVIWRTPHASFMNGITNFDEVFDRAERYHRSAQFQRAKDELNAIMSASAETNLKKYENIPYVAKHNGILRVIGSYRFDDAIEACPYFQSKELIRAAKAEYDQLVEKRTLAQQKLMQYAQEEDRFKSIEARFPGVFTELKNLASQRNPNRKRFEALQTEINTILTELFRIAPMSSSYKIFTERLANLGGK